MSKSTPRMRKDLADNPTIVLGRDILFRNYVKQKSQAVDNASLLNFKNKRQKAAVLIPAKPLFVEQGSNTPLPYVLVPAKSTVTVKIKGASGDRVSYRVFFSEDAPAVGDDDATDVESDDDVQPFTLTLATLAKASDPEIIIN